VQQAQGWLDLLGFVWNCLGLVVENGKNSK